MASRENSLTVMMRAASFTVRATLKRSCARRSAGEVFRMFNEADIVDRHHHRESG